jgi:hypothetical protein
LFTGARCTWSPKPNLLYLVPSCNLSNVGCCISYTHGHSHELFSNCIVTQQCGHPSHISPSALLHLPGPA